MKTAAEIKKLFEALSQIIPTRYQQSVAEIDSWLADKVRAETPQPQPVVGVPGGP